MVSLTSRVQKKPFIFDAINQVRLCNLQKGTEPEQPQATMIALQSRCRSNENSFVTRKKPEIPTSGSIPNCNPRSLKELINKLFASVYHVRRCRLCF